VRQLQKNADEVPTERDVDARYRTVASAELQPLADAAKVEEAGILVLPRSRRLFEHGDFQNLVAGIRCPVFVVR